MSSPIRSAGGLASEGRAIHPAAHDRSTSDGDGGQPRSRGSWTREEIRILVTLWPKLDNAKIAVRLGRNENAIAIKASRLGLPPRQKVREMTSDRPSNSPKAKIRPCLKCRTPFYSEGAHHRICDSCKGGSSWQSGAGNYVVSLGDF